jgi:2-polyprenyl-3-methyl-5-hydroxy-6-metoxy-1,4-benzoquinol methylase
MKVDVKFISSIEQSAKTTDLTAWYTLLKTDHFWFAWREAVFFREMDCAGIPKNANLSGMDIGCGQGEMRREIEKYTNWIMDGVDINLESLYRNKNCIGKTMFYNILDRKNVMKSHYDILILFDVLEHIDDPKAFLDAACFHIKSGGYLIINVPACPSLFSQYDAAAGHLRRYSKPGLRAALQTMGLEVITETYWGFSLVPLLFLRKCFFKCRNLRRDEILKIGFEPPGSLTNGILKLVGCVERRFIQQPFIGSSLIVVARKAA